MATDHPVPPAPAPLPVATLAEAAARVLEENGFEADFPPEVTTEVAALPEDIPAPEPAVRDLRALPWSSIDNRESRDLDQVEVVEALPHAVLRLRVGIADVDSRVERASATDSHAGRNTTSVYTGVAVFPMLPERLSTDLTSLNEAEDRLAVVAEIDVEPGGAVRRETVYRAVVHNHAKLDYDTTGRWLEGAAPPPPEVAADPGLEEQLRLQDEVAQRLLANRRRSGILDLETVEPRPVVVDGKVIDIRSVARNRARDLIEAFMVAANGTLARFLRDRRLPAIRRVVRTPKRWDRIVDLAAQLGEKLPAEPDAAALSSFLGKRRRADPVRFPDLSLAVVKLLGAGEYVLERRADARENAHFSLGAAEYAHATAPNRRYADLVLQRLAKSALLGTPSGYTDDELSDIAARCTEREKAARKVERSMRKKAAAALMTERVGDRFVGVVTGVSDKGTYVRVLQPPVEGRIVSGQDGLDVGDTVRVTLVSVDPERGFIDFAGPSGDIRHKLERTRLKRKAALRLARHVGESFAAIVTAASDKGTWVRLLRHRASGRVVRGQKALRPGQRVDVVLVTADSVHGFIDFEYTAGLQEFKLVREARKRDAALVLRPRVGDLFDAVVTGATPRATWIRLRDPEVEGRLIRGRSGLRVGDGLRVRLLNADPQRGFIDFARE